MLKRILKLNQVLGLKHSAFLFGARGVGKTHLVREFIDTQQKQALEVDLLKGESYERYLKSPQVFRLEVEAALKRHKNLLISVDEIQRVPSLLNEVHSLVESHRNQLQFLLTGSSARKLKRGSANLLAGRALSLKLHPLTHEECDLPLETYLRLGSLPGVVFENDRPEATLRSYVTTYLREEIQQEALVRKIDAFARFLELAAQYHGEAINASSIGDAAGISANTVLEYFQILQDTLIGWSLPGWSASVKKQLRTTPKFFLFDNGVVNTLRGELNIELKESSTRYGKLFEAWVIQEILRFNDYHELDLKFSYWRTNNDMEVDVIVSRGIGQPLAAIEIKSSTHPADKEMRGITAFAEEYPDVPRYCFCRTPRAFLKEQTEFLSWQDGIKILKQL